MAKMFYTLEEAAEKLGVDEQQVREMASRGELQQFRDGEKLMFKSEQVDAVAASNQLGGSTMGGSAGLSLSDTGVPAGQESGGPIPLAGSGDTDAINLADESHASDAPKTPAPSASAGGDTGVSVFDTHEIDHADPLAQTQLTKPNVDDEELALDSVGSGSGLLDLTRESDDTSLGAELLDEIYPGGTNADTQPGLDTAAGTNIATGFGTELGTSAGTALGATQGGTAVGSSGVFDTAMETAAGAAAAVAPAQGTPAAPGTQMAAGYAGEEEDPAGSGFSAGVLMGATLALIIALLAAIGAMGGAQTPVTGLMAADSTSMMIWSGGLLLVCVILGVVGLVLGKATAR